MKAAPVVLPAALQSRLGVDTLPPFMAVGNTNLLTESLLGLLASRQCPGQVLLETLELAAQWARSQQVVLSGFHSPLEQQVLRSMLRRRGRVVKLLARAFDNYRVPPEEKAALADGYLLVLSACAPSITRTTRASSLARNRLVLALAAEHCVPYLTPDSPLHGLVAVQPPQGCSSFSSSPLDKP